MLNKNIFLLVSLFSLNVYCGQEVFEESAEDIYERGEKKDQKILKDSKEVRKALKQLKSKFESEEDIRQEARAILATIPAKKAYAKGWNGQAINLLTNYERQIKNLLINQANRELGLLDLSQINLN